MQSSESAGHDSAGIAVGVAREPRQRTADGRREQASIASQRALPSVEASERVIEAGLASPASDSPSWWAGA